MTYANTSDGRARPNVSPEIEEDDDDDFKGLTPEAAAALAQCIANIQKARNERRAASRNVTDKVKETLQAHGFDKQTFAFITKLSEMEPLERKRFLHRVDEYATKLRYY